MLVSVPPTISISNFMRDLKEKIALMVFDKYSNLKINLWNRHFQTDGYYVSVVGFNEAIIRKYIQEQKMI